MMNKNIFAAAALLLLGASIQQVKAQDISVAGTVRDIYGNPLPGDPRVCSGESGAVTLGLFSLLMQAPSLAAARDALGLGKDSRVLLVSTEGDTDPQRYLDIVWDGEIPSHGLIK